MNQRNYQFLTDDLEKMGLEDSLNPLLKQKIESNLFEEFPLTARGKIENEKMEITPFFVQSKDPEFQDYFNINHVRVTLFPENGEAVQIRFPHFKELKFNKEQMYRMAKEMVPVYKIGRNEKIGQWAKVDKNSVDDDGYMRVKTYPDNETNFKLERHLDNLKVTWARGEKDNAIMDLQNGIPVTVTIKEKGEIQKAIIKVAPQFNALIMVDKENNVLQRTNTSNFTIEAAEGVGIENKSNQNLPASTKELMNKKDEAKKDKGQNKKVG